MWIKVSDQLPEDLKRVIIFHSGLAIHNIKPIVMEAFCRRNPVGTTWFKPDGSGIDYDLFVECWQDLPKAPQGAKEMSAHLLT